MYDALGFESAKSAETFAADFLRQSSIGEAQQTHLFPFDPWGVASSVGMAIAPASGIAFLCAAPLAVMDEVALDSSVTCLAVSSCGALAARVVSTQRKLLNGDAYEEIRKAFAVVANDPYCWSECVEDWQSALNATTPKADTKWSKAMRSWCRKFDTHGNTLRISGLAAMSHEESVSRRHRTQVEAAFRIFLSFIRADIREALCARPRASVHLAFKLFNAAQTIGGDAPLYARNAMRNECLGLLHWTALADSDRADSERGRSLRDDLLRGRSIQKRLASWGIPPAVHRITLKHHSRFGPQHASSLADRIQSTGDFKSCTNVLVALPTSRWPSSDAASAEFVGMIRQFTFRRYPDETVVELAKWSWSPSSGRRRAEHAISCIRAMADRYFKSTGRPVGYCQAAAALQKIIPNGFRHGDDSLEKLFSDLENPEKQTTAIAAAVGCSVEVVCRSYFQVAEKIAECIPKLYAGYGFIPITSLDDLHRHGNELRQCVADFRQSIFYLHHDVVLVKIRNVQGEIATLGVRYEQGNDGRRVWFVKQLATRANQPPCETLTEIARHYLRALNDSEELDKFMNNKPPFSAGAG
jgi:hypothetical protein